MSKMDSCSTSLKSSDNLNTTGFPSGKLEAWIGSPSCDWTADDLSRLFVERQFNMISLMHTGGDGWLKTLDFVPRSREHLLDIIEGGERADGSSLFRGMGIPSGASDIVLNPRPDTAFIDPFSPIPTLAIRCGHKDRNGNPLPQSPDTLIRKSYSRAMENTGVDLYALGEVEYFIGRKFSDFDVYGADDHGYHATAPMVFGESLRRRAMTVLAEMGAPMKYGHSEVGYIEEEKENGLIWEQHEIELDLAPLPDAADWVVMTQWVLRMLAHRDGMTVSFDPILRRGHAGNGLHFHLAPKIDGRSMGCHNIDGNLHEAARWLVGGLVKAGGALMAFGNRSPDSFIRLTQAKEAPNRILWGQFNRQALVRLPLSVCTIDGRCVSTPTIEFRLPDGSAHPHLLLAGIAQALVHGQRIENLTQILADTATSGADSESGTPVPLSEIEVAAAIQMHRHIFEDGDIFPSNMIDTIVDSLGKIKK